MVDAIDTVSSKLLLIERAKAAGVPIVSSMGTGNKLDPAQLEMADIYQTSVCPLARVMRRELKRRGIASPAGRIRARFRVRRGTAAARRAGAAADARQRQTKMPRWRG